MIRVLLLLSFVCLLRFTFPAEISSLTDNPLHRLCLSQIKKSMIHQELTAALVCGKNLTSTKTKDLFIRSSLIHIIVVSGSHFAVLAGILEFFQLPVLFIFFVLFLFLIMTGTQAPGVLAFLFFSIKKFIFPRAKSSHHLLLSGLLALVLIPQGLDSFSLYLSWLCTWLLIVQSESHRTHLTSDNDSPQSPALVFQQMARATAVIYFGLNILGGWSEWIKPMGFFLNLILAPLISSLLFPLAAFSLMITPVSVVYEHLTSAILFLLSRAIPPQPDVNPICWSNKYWFAFFFLIVIGEILLIKLRRDHLIKEAEMNATRIGHK